MKKLTRFTAILLSLLLLVEFSTLIVSASTAVTSAEELERYYPHLPDVIKRTETSSTFDVLRLAIAHHLDVPSDSDTLYELGYVTKEEKAFGDKQGLVTKGTAWRILLTIYEVYIPDYSLEANQAFDWKDAPQYYDAEVAALKSGLAHFDYELKPSDLIYITDLFILIDQLESGSYQVVGDVSAVRIPDTLSYLDWNINDPRDRRVLVYAYGTPQSWLEAFRADGWQIVRYWQSIHVLGSYDQEMFYDIMMKGYLGVTDYNQKALYLKVDNYFTFIHELAHFATDRAWIENDFLQTLYDAEAQNAVDVLRSYAQTNKYEYLAVFVEHWQMYPADRQLLAEKLPQTTEAIVRLLNGEVEW